MHRMVKLRNPERFQTSSDFSLSPMLNIATRTVSMLGNHLLYPFLSLSPVLIAPYLSLQLYLPSLLTYFLQNCSKIIVLIKSNRDYHYTIIVLQVFVLILFSSVEF